MIRSFNYISILLPLFFLGTINHLAAQEIQKPDTIIHYVPYDTLMNELDEVVITGTRVSKRIIDIPYSVVRINNLQYRHDRKIGVNDVLSSVPGMFLQSRYGNHDVRISIRVFGSRSRNPTGRHASRPSISTPLAG